MWACCESWVWRQWRPALSTSNTRQVRLACGRNLAVLAPVSSPQCPAPLSLTSLVGYLDHEELRCTVLGSRSLMLYAVHCKSMCRPVISCLLHDFRQVNRAI